MELEKQSIVGCLAEDFDFSSWMAHNKPNGLSYAVLHIFCSVNNLHSLRERNLKHFSDAFDRSALKNIIRINTYCCKFAKQRSQYRHIIIDATQQNRLISHRLRVTALGSSDTVLPVVEAVPGITGVQLVSEADGEVTFTAETADTTDRRAEVSRALSEAGCTVLALAAENRSLEEVFLALTGETADVPEEPETEPKGE